MSKDNKLCVLQVHNGYQIPGGEDVVAENEKKLLEQHGHKVIGYYRNNLELKEMNAIQKILIPLTAIFSVKTYREIKKIIKNEKVDIVHVHNTLMVVSPSVFYAAFHCHVPVVQTLHNFRMLCPAGSFFRDSQICEECVKCGLSHAIKHKCYRNSAVQSLVSASILKIHRMLGTYRKVNFICLTEFNRKKILLLNCNGKKIVDQNKIYVKPNFTFEDHESFENCLDMKYYLFVGRVEALKGIDIVVRAFEKLPDEKLVIAGSGPMMEEMKAYIRERNIKNIEFAGYLRKDELREKYSHAKAVIMASQCYEAFAMTIAEAYAYGVPVIAGDVGNLTNMVKDGVTGVKFVYNSPEKLVEAIHKYNHMDIMNMKQNAKRFYQKNLLAEDNYHLLEQIYTKIMNESESVK